ncbi:hypothetical protein P8882_03550 [Bacillus haynesii]|nr:hypothetical protein [Bacillus haynesii]
MKLDDNVDFRKFSDDIHRQLHADNPSGSEKQGILTIVILFLDLLCAIPLLVDGEILFTLIALPFMIIINIWTIIVLFMRPDERNNLFYTLYKGATGAVVSFCYFVLSQKYAYSVIGSNSLFIITSFLTYLIVIIGLIRYYLVIFPDNNRKKKDSPAWGTYLLTIGPAGGYIVSQFVFRFSDSVVDLFMSYVFLLFACIWSWMGVKFIHKFYFIKANKDIIDKHLRKGK